MNSKRIPNGFVFDASVPSDGNHHGRRPDGAVFQAFHAQRMPAEYSGSWRLSGQGHSRDGCRSPIPDDARNAWVLSESPLPAMLS